MKKHFPRCFSGICAVFLLMSVGLVGCKPTDKNNNVITTTNDADTQTTFVNNGDETTNQGETTITNNEGDSMTTTKSGATTTTKIVNSVTTTTTKKQDVYIPPFSVPNGEAIGISKLQTDSRFNPLGIDDKTPVFSWIIDSTRRGEKQTAYRVGVSSSREKLNGGNFDVWDSGKVTSSDTSITYGAVNGSGGKKAAALKAQTQYYWTVYAWNKNGVENRSSEIGNFETALFGDFGKQNKWITAKKDAKANETAGRLFRKQFTLSQPIENVSKARLYSTAVGNQVMYLNGKRASDDYFAPGFTKFTALLYYQTYDVTSLIQSGDNTVAAEVGQGWFNSGAISSNYGSSNVALKAKLIITYKNGQQQVIDTDSSWEGTMSGATLSNRFYDGQAVDGREYIQGWSENNCTSLKWLPAVASDTLATPVGAIGTTFVAEQTEPVRNIATLKPISQEDKGNLRFSRLYTFGQNIAGTVRIKAKAKTGVKMSVKYCEFLTNGTITGDEYLNGRNGTDSYIFRGDADGETITFDLVYHGFQYILISNNNTEKSLRSEPIEILSVEALVLSADLEKTYTFDSSNQDINQYVQNVFWSLRGNFMSTITDCPTRERNSWAGDAQIISGTAPYFLDSYGYFRNFQTLTRLSALGDGGFTEILPEASHNNAASSDKQHLPAGWTDSAIIIPWQMYHQYGDIHIIEDNYSTMKNYINCLVSKRVYKNGDEVPYFIVDPTDVRLDGGSVYGDWLSYNAGYANPAYYEKTYGDSKESGPRPISLAETDTAYLAHCCNLLSQMAIILGEKSDADYYHKLYQRFAKAWRTNFVAKDGFTCTSNGRSVKNADGSYTYIPGQGWITSYAIGLNFHLFENEEMEKKAAAKLANLLKTYEYKQIVGFQGIDCLYYALSNNGQFDTALKVLENDEPPSVLYMVKQGATTVWENYLGPKTGGTESRNHFVFGAPAGWLFKTVLGITHGYENQNVGYTHFFLEPHHSSASDTTLTWVKGSYTAETGTIKSEWSLSSDRKTFTYKCTVPANTSATLSLPISNNNATITESGKAANTATGVKFIEIKDGRAYYEITSGTYEFVVKN